ncbi:MAG: RHS repeat protein, partial [Elusimicrobiales bacterium]|nr:RHS repeat protein [Elusimicrobiales bacterium]
PVQFGIKDVEADWSAAKMMKSLDWGAQAPRFDIGKFGNLLNMESEWLTGLGERFKGVGPVFKDGSFDFNTPGFDSPKWNGSGSGLPGYSGGDNLLGDNDPSICSIYPAPGLPEEGVSSVQSGNSQRIGAFSLFKKSDGQAKTLYAAAGITKNPVNTVSGNLLYWVEDIALPGGQLFVQLMRVYNSLAPKNGPFGYGWSFNYGMSVEENSENATLLIGDGGKRLFFKNADGIFSSPVGTYSKLSKEADGSYTLTHIHGTRYLFSSGGKLSNIIDRNDNTIALAYSQECLSSMTDPSGRVVNFECDADKRITKITDFTGRALTYQYDNRGDMIKVTGTDGYNADYVYGSNHELLSYNDHTSRTGFDSGKFEYDEFNRVTTEFDSADNRIAAFSYTFSGDNMTTVITDAEGNITRDIYDEDGIWKSRKNPDGREVQLTFDSSANLLKIDDGISATEMTYDSLNRSKSLKVGAKTLASYDYDG